MQATFYPGLCEPTNEGGLGFDYFVNMSVSEMWLWFLENLPDRDWSMNKVSLPSNCDIKHFGNFTFQSVEYCFSGLGHKVSSIGTPPESLGLGRSRITCQLTLRVQLHVKHSSEPKKKSDSCFLGEYMLTSFLIWALNSLAAWRFAASELDILFYAFLLTVLVKIQCLLSHSFHISFSQGKQGWDLDLKQRIFKLQSEKHELVLNFLGRLDFSHSCKKMPPWSPFHLGVAHLNQQFIPWSSLTFPLMKEIKILNSLSMSPSSCFFWHWYESMTAMTLNFCHHHARRNHQSLLLFKEVWMCT